MATKIGWYGDSAVRLPIQAPPTPRLNSTSGRMQHDIDANAPRTPPAASHACPLFGGTETRSCDSCFSRITRIALDLSLGRQELDPVPATGSKAFLRDPSSRMRERAMRRGELAERLQHRDGSLLREAGAVAG